VGGALRKTDHAKVAYHEKDSKVNLAFDCLYVALPDRLLAVVSWWVTHRPIDWRQVLGSFLFCLVVALMGLNQQLGIDRAHRIAEEILAKHQADSATGTHANSSLR
jgi:hypothetical protein